MMVIFKNLPQLATRWQLERLIKSHLSAGWFMKGGSLKDLRMLQNEDKMGRAMEYHAIAMIDPDVVARRVIKSLNNKPMFGTQLQVCEYTVRQWQNDRRAQSTSAFIQQLERRRDDRRRKGLELALYHKHGEQ